MMKTKTARPLVTLTAIGFAVAISAVAADARERPDFEALDLDANGEITGEEMTAHAARRFSETDSNGDGRIDLGEMQAAAREAADDRAARRLDRLDTDGDGALSPAEITARRDPVRLIERLDADGSGGVSKAEFAAARARHQARKGGQD